MTNLILKSTFWVGILFGMGIVANATEANLDDSIGIVSNLKGEVILHRKGTDDIKATKGLEIKVGDLVETKAASAARLVMKDRNVFILNENSKLEFKDYYFKNPQGNTTVILDGELRSDIQNKSKDDKPNFRIVTPGGVVGIRGTEFLAATHDKKLTVTTFEGAVEMGESLQGRKIQNAVTVEKGFQFTGSAGQYDGKSAYLLTKEEFEKIKSSFDFPEADIDMNSQKTGSNDKSSKDKKSTATQDETKTKKTEHVK